MKNLKAEGKEAKATSKSKSQNKSKEREVEVLYQRLGNRWFAFSLIDDEIFVGSLPEQNLSEEEPKESTPTERKSKSKKLAGNS